MSNGTTKSNTRPPLPPTDAVPAWGRVLMGFGFIALAALTFYVLIATWPVPNAPGKFESAKIWLFKTWTVDAAPDQRLFIMVAAAGALGSLVHSTTSFVDYVGNQKLSRHWIWWLILRTPIGMALALLFYLVLRGGLIAQAPPAGNGGTTIDATGLVNPYGIAAISAMAGMFSKQATDKLREIFDTLFQTREPVSRADPLDETAPVISGVTPPTLVVNAQQLTLELQGSGFQNDAKASVDGEERTLEWVSDTLVRVTLLPKDVAAAKNLKLIVENPQRGASSPFTVPVKAS